jgi:MFS family permease
MTTAQPPSDQLVRNRPFVLFWLMRVFATLGMQMQAVAVGWQLYDLTNSPLDLGLVGLAQFLPAMLLFLLTGHAADRFDRRQILRICQCVEGVAIAVLAWCTYTGTINRDVILLASLALGAARAFEGPTIHALLPTIVPATLFPRAVAGSASANQFATIAGPAIGGVIYAINPVAAYALPSILFFLAATLVTLIPILMAGIRREPFTLKSLFAGFAFIRHQPVILGAIAIDLFAVLLGASVAILPVFARDILHTDAEGLGFLRASPAIGALAVSLVLMRWPLRGRAGHALFACIAIFGAATLVFGFSRSLPLSMAALAILGAADLVSVVIRSTLVQLATPDAMRGRVSAVNSLFISASNQLGEFRAGAVAAALGAVPAVLIGGLCSLFIVAAGLRLFPALFRVDDMQSVRPPEKAP